MQNRAVHGVPGGVGYHALDLKPHEVRFETKAGIQAQVNFARSVVEFTDEPEVTRIVRLFGLSVTSSARMLVHSFQAMM